MSFSIQHLSNFMLSESQRQNVGNTLRKRNKPADCAEENDCGSIIKGETKSQGSDETSSSSRVDVKLRFRRARRSTKVGEGVRILNSKLERLSQSHSPPLEVGQEVEELQISPTLCSQVPEEVYKRLEAGFYACDALELAPKLLGKLIRRDDVILQITEVEAYRPGDSACHARVGQTSRTAPMFGPGGHAYVYLCYGMHVMLNVTADREGVGAAVLIRACSPVAGLTSIRLRRGQVTNKPVLLTGPGKVGQALGLTTEWSAHPLYMPGGLEILDAPAPANMLVGPRVGIDYADPEDVAALWRFAIADNLWEQDPKILAMLRGNNCIEKPSCGNSCCTCLNFRQALL